MPHSHKITPQEALQRTIEHREIFHDEMLHLMRLIMSGEMSPVMRADIMTGDISPLMMSRIRCSISSWKISRCSMVRCSASCGV
ncbi:MAG: hypothetical protein Q7J66_20060, partial [Hydrogenophaga sp.]|nr:hypothetical protein [Hydrogenophaga sp.]